MKKTDVGIILVGKFDMKVEIKEIEKIGMELDSKTEIEKFTINLERINEVGRLQRNSPISTKLFNFGRTLPTLLGSFQFKQKFSNFKPLNFNLTDYSFYPTVLFNYKHSQRILAAAL